LDDETEKNCPLIDIAIPDDSNFYTEETEKLTKYKDLAIEFSRKWRLRAKFVLVVFGALGTINPLTPNDYYTGRTAPLTSKRCILYIYSTNIGTGYF